MNAVPGLLGKVLPATVHVHAKIPAEHPSAALLGVERMGTGTVVEADGVVLTVSYVVIGAEELSVTTLDGETRPAELLKYDFASGLAAIRVPDLRWPFLPLRDSSAVHAGDPAFIVASVGPGAVRAADGFVSHVGPFDANWEYVVERGLMTTAMNPGLGGGPLVDTLGRMLGVASLNLAAVGRFTFVVPSEGYLASRDAFLADDGETTLGTRAWLGVFCYQLERHVIVAGLMADGPAARAGLKPGDVVLALDYQEIGDRAALYREVWARQPGEPVAVRVFREKVVKTFTIPVGDVARYFA